MSKSRPQQALAVVAAMLLVATAVGGAAGVGPVGTASAQAADTEECSTWDAIIYDAVNFGNINLLGGDESENPCSAEYAQQQIADEWNATDAAETRAEIHSRAGQLAASNEQYLNALDNGLTNSETIAFSRAEAAAVEVLANGGNVSEAQQAANESIEDYYTIKQRNLYDRWGIAVETAFTLNSRANNTTNLNDDFVTFGDSDDFGDNWDTSSSSGLDTRIQGDLFNGETVQTINGSTVQVKTISFNFREGSTSRRVGFTPGKTLSDEYTSTTVLSDFQFEAGWASDPGQLTIDRIRVRPTEDLAAKTVINIRDFRNQLSAIRAKSNKTKQEAAVYINQSLAQAAEDGDLSDHISPSTLVQEYSQNINGSDGYVRALAIAASSGMSTPDLEGTASMTVTHDGTTYQGMLLSQNAPDNGSWQAGETYDATLIGGKQFFAVSDSESGEVIELDGPFTVDSITDMSGNSVDTAQTQSYDYTVTNQSANYSELQQQIRSLQEELELQKERATAPEPGAGGGGGDGGGWALPSWGDLLPSDGALAGLALGGGTLALVGLVGLALVIGIVLRILL